MTNIIGLLDKYYNKLFMYNLIFNNFIMNRDYKCFVSEDLETYFSDEIIFTITKSNYYKCLEIQSEEPEKDGH